MFWTRSREVTQRLPGNWHRREWVLKVVKSAPAILRCRMTGCGKRVGLFTAYSVEKLSFGTRTVFQHYRNAAEKPRKTRRTAD